MRKLIEKHQQSNGRGRGIIQLNPETWEAYIQSQLNIPGTGITSNSSVQQANQRARYQEKVERDNPKTKAEGSYRNIERRRKSGKTKDQEDTERDIKLATQPTWRTEAADAAHYIGTGLSTIGGGLALLSNPVTTGVALVGGLAGGRAVDKASQKLTGKTWAENVQKKLGLQTPTLAEFTNPGYFIGGGLGLKGKGALDYLIKADMPRFGYTPTTKYYFKPGYVGINGGFMNSSKLAPPISMTKLLQGLNNSKIQENDIVNSLPDYLQITRAPNGKVYIVETKEGALAQFQKQLGDKYGVDLNMVKSQIGEKDAQAKQGKTLNVEKDGVYTRQDLFYPNNEPKYPRAYMLFDRVRTGSHGNLIDTSSSPETVFKYLTDLDKNRFKGVEEVYKVMRDNPKGRSGIILGTKPKDTSSDSFGLGLKYSEKLAPKFTPIEERFIPEEFRLGTHVENNAHGYKNLFRESDQWEFDPKIYEYLENPDRYFINENGQLEFRHLPELPFEVVRENSDPKKLGSILLKDRGVKGQYRGRIEALPSEDVLENFFNIPIRNFNSHFNVNYPEARFSISAPGQWTFRKGIESPNFLGILHHKKGGNIVQNFKNRNK